MEVIVIGATGLVGKNIVKKLIADERVSKVITFTRRLPDLTHPKLDARIVNFDQIHSWKDQIKGDVLFSALGTTLRDAGSKEKQYLVDHDYQLSVAVQAAYNEIKNFVLISSVNADPKSFFFYLRMKGELEEKLSKLPFASLFILRPGPLVGTRSKPRWQEKISTMFLNLLPKALVSPGMRPVSGERVAEVAVRSGLSNEVGIHIIGPRRLLTKSSKTA
jgi:uncharacterized protein YbjT (DUF2867 family)